MYPSYERPAIPVREASTLGSSFHQGGVLEREIRWEQRLWNAAAIVHCVEAEPAGEIADEKLALSHSLGAHEKSGRKQ